MRKRIFITISVLAVVIGLMAWDVYENNKQEALAIAKAQKIHTVSDILKNPDFNVQITTLDINNVAVENEVQQKRIIHALANLKLQESKNFYPWEQATRVDIKADKEYSMYVFEKEKNIFFMTGEHSISYDIVNGENLFEALKDNQ
ncbi:hypothetical protein [Lysinibacillus cavernae]|uniref:hypothetical protein n=1 Tax=Lysinibacillus cavernae TaxID=2666135 RepID=UPI0012D9FF59|nr:hypothetical protein [Lysinibacillus cavernae]